MRYNRSRSIICGRALIGSMCLNYHPQAWQEFDDLGRMKDSPFRERLVDVLEEFAKFTRIMREHADFLVDRHSEREEKRREGRLLSQAEKEAAKTNSS